MEHKYCVDCNLQFSNEQSFEKHKAKFCQYVKGNHFERSSSTSYERKSNTVSSLGFIDKMKVFSINDRNENNIADLKTEEEKLETERQAIVEQLNELTKNLSRSSGRDPTAGAGTKRASSSKKVNNNENANDDDLANSTSHSMLKMPTSGTGLHPVRTSIKQNHTLRAPSNQEYRSRENQLLKNIRDMYNDYITNGGEDEEVMEYFRNLENDMKKFEEKTLLDVEKLVYNLKGQLHEYHNANDELRKEIELLKKNDERSNRNDNVRNQSRHSNVYHLPEPEMNRSQYVRNQGNQGNYHEKRLMELRQEAELYRQQLELEHLRCELNSLRGHPSKPILPLIGSQQHYPPQRNHEVVNTDNDLYQITQEQNDEAFQSAPYDPGSGFTVFWDFVSAPDRPCDCCRLLVTLYKGDNAVSETKILPSIPFSPFSPGGVQHSSVPGTVAVLGVKQMFPQCFPMSELSLCIALQTGNRQHASDTTGMLTDCGWCKIEMFDNFNRLKSGRWKVPVRILPIHAGSSASELNTIPQLGQTEIFYRLVNSRNTQPQEGNILVPQIMVHYKYAPLESYPVFTLPQVAMGPRLISRKESEHAKNPIHASGKHSLPPPTPVKIQPEESFNDDRPNSEIAQVFEPTQPPLQKNAEAPLPNTSEDVIRPISLPSLSNLTAENDIGIQIDRLLDLSMDPAKVVVSIYNPDGKLGHTNNGKAQFSTKYISPTFLEKVHGFSLEQCLFPSLQWYRWSIIEFVVYEKPDESDDVVGWTVLPLYEGDSSNFNNTRNSNSTISSQARLATEFMKSGHVNLQLYKPPLIEPKTVIEKLRNSKHFGEFSGASLCVFLSNGIVPLTKAPLFIPSSQRHRDPPAEGWIDFVRQVPQTIFRNGKGFDVYVDAGRMFPDSTVATKVVVGFYEGPVAAKKDPFKYRYETAFDMETNAFEPVYDLRIEFREFTFKPQSKLVFMVYILDAVTKQVALLGQNIVPIFVKPNTFESVDVDASSYCLNSGNMQLRLFQEVDDKVTFDKDKLRKPVLCSSLLVRIIDAPCYSDGEPKRSREFPEDQWVTEGLLVPHPKYDEGSYDSQECIPSDAEKELMHYIVKRKPVTVEDMLKGISPGGRKTRMDKSLVDFVKMQKIQAVFDTNYLIKYDPMHGFFISIVKAQNLRWNGFTFVSYCISPPGCFYLSSVDDPVELKKQLNLDSPQKHPEWTGPVKLYPRRRYHPNLSLVIQLYEISPVGSEFAINPMAWTLFPIIQAGYLQQGGYQIPLFQGTPTKDIISDLQVKPIIPSIAALRKKKILKMAEGSSVYFRVGDCRRIEDATSNDIVFDKSFLPKVAKFNQLLPSENLKSRFPAGISPDDYVENMGNAFDNYITDVFIQRRRSMRE